jgi:hypothetical protein
MADSPGKPVRAPSFGLEPEIIRRPLVPPRRMSLGEEEAFPVTAADIQAPRLPPDVEEQNLSTTGASEPGRKPRRSWMPIVFVVVAALGALAAARFYFAAMHDAASQE